MWAAAKTPAALLSSPAAGSAAGSAAAAASASARSLCAAAAGAQRQTRRNYPIQSAVQTVVASAYPRAFDDSNREGGRDRVARGSSLRQGGRGGARSGHGGGRDGGRSGSRDNGRAPFRETRFTEESSIREQAPRRDHPSPSGEETTVGDRAPRRDFRSFDGPRSGDRAPRRDFRYFDGPRNGDDNGDDDGNGDDNEELDEEWEGDGYAQPGAVRNVQDRDMPRAPTIRDELAGTVLYGVFPVLNALKAKRRTLHTLYVLGTLDTSKRKDASALREVFKLAKAMELPVRKEVRHNLNLLSDYKQHQGLVLDCSPLEWSPMDILPSVAGGAHGAAPPVWLALDEVSDPQNFGALVRSAHCLGAAGVLVCAKNCAPLSPTASKASAGVLEVCEVHSCANMVRTLQSAAGAGWRVLGAVADARAEKSRDVSVAQPTVLVMGNEGTGLRTNVKRACTGYIAVEMGAPKSQLAADSLNVSVAAGILMHTLVSAAEAGAAQRQPSATATEAAAEA